MAVIVGSIGLILILVLIVQAFGSSGPPPTAAQQRQAERAANPVHFTVSVSGDLLIHSFLWERALANGGGSTYDFTPFFTEIKRYVAGQDLAVCHVETPMTPAPPTSYPVFNTPPELAKAIKATGWEACDTASNHSLDDHQSGIKDTGLALDRQGIGHTGSFNSPAERRTPLILNVKGIKVGYLAYSDYTNGIPLPHPWSENVAPFTQPVKPKADRILADAKRDFKAGAEAVILNMHWGDEYEAEPNASQSALADRLTRSPYITAIVGQGPHVVDPIQKINGKYVVFSEGNLVSNQGEVNGTPANTQYGLIALLHFVANGSGVSVKSISYVPTWVRLSDYLVLPVGLGLKDDPADAQYLREAYDSVVATVGKTPGVNPIPASLPPQ